MARRNVSPLAFHAKPDSLVIEGELTRETLPTITGELQAPFTSPTTLDVSQMTRCDGAGVAFLYLLQHKLEERECTCQWVGLPKEIQQQFTHYERSRQALPSGYGAPSEPAPLTERLGRFVWDVGAQQIRVLSFCGELVSQLCEAVVNWRAVRWKDFVVTCLKAGYQAVPVVMLIGFLLGLILAFQSAIPMKMFGAEVYVGGLVGLALVRELGPIITAILIAGRSGSAFAAEIGTMKVNEEVDALETMGLNPLRFLALPRILAGTVLMPLLSLFATASGLLGGWVVMKMMGFPLAVYLNQLRSFISLGDLMGGLGKSFAFGFAVSAIGCYCGLHAGSDAEAVGTTTTRSVVVGIVSVAVIDGLFAVLFYAMGW